MIALTKLSITVLIGALLSFRARSSKSENPFVFFLRIFLIKSPKTPPKNFFFFLLEAPIDSIFLVVDKSFSCSNSFSLLLTSASSEILCWYAN